MYVCIYIYVCDNNICHVCIPVCHPLSQTLINSKCSKIICPPFRPFGLAGDLLRQCHPNLLQGGW